MICLRLEPPIWMDTPKGPAYAILMTDPSHDGHRQWTCVVQATGEIWEWTTPHIRVSQNITLGVNTQPQSKVLTKSTTRHRKA